MMAVKTSRGRFFEDYRVGQVIAHAVPRTVSGGERALYHALYPARHALYSSDEFARASGLPGAPIDDLAVFHLVFGKTVPDISLNAVANLGYAEGRFLAPVWPQPAWPRGAALCALGDGEKGRSRCAGPRDGGARSGRCGGRKRSGGARGAGFPPP
jgi:2-methylfumaryl-CoA hydratase